MKIVVLDGYTENPGGPAPERGEQVIRLPQEKQVVEK